MAAVRTILQMQENFYLLPELIIRDEQEEHVDDVFEELQGDAHVQEELLWVVVTTGVNQGLSEGHAVQA